MIRLLESVAEITVAVIGFAMKLAPFGVFCLIFSVIARFGFHLLINLIQYVLTVVGGCSSSSSWPTHHPRSRRPLAPARFLPQDPHRHDHRVLDLLVERDATTTCG